MKKKSLKVCPLVKECLVIKTQGYRSREEVEIDEEKKPLWMSKREKKKDRL